MQKKPDDSITVGIDFGTTYSSCAIYDGRAFQFVESRAPIARRIPTSIFKQGGNFEFGFEAKSWRTTAPQNYTEHFKRMIGDPSPVILGDQSFPIVNLVAEYLRMLRTKCGEKFKFLPTRTVLTHPASYADYKKGALREAAKLAGFEKVHLLQEPVAAALSHCWAVTPDQRFAKKYRAGEPVLIYDFGGGTFDAAYCQPLTDSSMELLTAPVGRPRCGGIDFDQRLIHDMATRGGKAFADAISGLDAASIGVLLTCRDAVIAAKEELSSKNVVELFPPKSDAYELKRSEFERLILDLIEGTVTDCRRLVGPDNGTKLKTILLVGGSSKVPLIAKRLREEFPSPKVEITLSAEPDLAIVKGAALRARHIDLVEQVEEGEFPEDTGLSKGHAVHFEEAKRALNLGQFDLSGNKFRWLWGESRDLWAYYGLAISLLNMRTPGGLAEAERILKNCMSLDPSNSDCACSLGDALLFQGMYLEAERCFRQALNLRPNHSGAVRGLQQLGFYV